ncbi:SGNH/GDSL hydrolase family protein [Paenibacillus ihuae]|uniref:SGNH/GDSL hydrolase family protein n=1 Tax=Paenibacillus ihuae TaxID=1232431 RepID=UPI0006D52DE0|nr:GDSL-type esterase/lipase family protein [Paenibacillus ihuae]
MLSQLHSFSGEDWSKPNKVILFQGDSIIDGNRGRDEDPNHIHGHGYAYLIASKLGSELAELQPDVLSILIGVNNIWRALKGEPGGITDSYERAYRHVLEETREVLPQTKLVLMEPFILNTGAPAEDWPEWHERITCYQQVVRKLTEAFDAVFVPLQDMFEAAAQRADNAYWLWDGVHPTTAGHDLIAKQWMSLVEKSGILND